MTDLSKYELQRDTVKEVIRRLSKFCWNFRKPDSKEDLALLVDMWHRALSGHTYWQEIYLEAVDSWLRSAKAGCPPPYPGDILEHCQRVVERIESDPKRRPALEKWREDYKMARIAELTGEPQ